MKRRRQRARSPHKPEFARRLPRGREAGRQVRQRDRKPLFAGGHGQHAKEVPWQQQRERRVVVRRKQRQVSPEQEVAHRGPKRREVRQPTTRRRPLFACAHRRLPGWQRRHEGAKLQQRKNVGLARQRLAGRANKVPQSSSLAQD